MPTPDSLPLRQELGAGERILWTGRPKQGLMLRRADALLIPFSLMWGGFAITWQLAVLSGDAPLLFKLWGVPFVLVGLYLIFGRFFVDARLRAQTVYAVTNERILIESGLVTLRLRSISLKAMTDITFDRPDAARGTITFGAGASPYAGWLTSAGGWPGLNRDAAPVFEMIEGHKRVIDLIRRAQRDLETRPQENAP